MSRYDYEYSKRIMSYDPSFDALIMAAMRKADTHNMGLLQRAFPEIWKELAARYDAPGGILPEERYPYPKRGDQK